MEIEENIDKLMDTLQVIQNEIVDEETYNRALKKIKLMNQEDQIQMTSNQIRCNIGLSYSPTEVVSLQTSFK